ncbi:GTP-binding protein Rheb-like [Tropilaelaps mercedesae]|uniref:GTP-binding protein Rheb-like n=1 Tax=Tropilaelaps mercedesae TaxID=418985 RepID=A0A1V9X8M4_9ACAR|nr:GTP-binding protein Rheb-like [Tropilaelaps mercedesae]
MRERASRGRFRGHFLLIVHSRAVPNSAMPAVYRKVAIMGYRSVGKSSLTIQFVENQFVDSYDPTIENSAYKPTPYANAPACATHPNIGTASMLRADNIFDQAFTKNLKFEGKDVSLKIIDTAGQDEFSIFPPGYTMDIHGYVLVYSVTSKQSFEIVKKIYHKLLDQTGMPQLPVVLVGNKNDLRNERVVSHEEGRELARYMKGVFLEASAKQNDCVLDIFTQLISRINALSGQRNNQGGDSRSGCVVC